MHTAVPTAFSKAGVYEQASSAQGRIRVCIGVGVCRQILPSLLFFTLGISSFILLAGRVVQLVLRDRKGKLIGLELKPPLPPAPTGLPSYMPYLFRARSLWRSTSSTTTSLVHEAACASMSGAIHFPSGPHDTHIYGFTCCHTMCIGPIIDSPRVGVCVWSCIGDDDIPVCRALRMQ